MTVRYYRYDDASAPVISGAAGSFVAALRACLVTGYGSQLPAGWTEEFTGTNKAAFKGAGGTGFLLRVDASGTANARVIGYESMSGIDTGTNGFPLEAQLSGGEYMYHSALTDGTARPWIIVADERRVWVWVGASLTIGGGLAASTTQQPIMHFGDFASDKVGDLYNCALLAGHVSGASGSYVGAVGSISAVHNAHFVARAADGAVGSRQVGKYGNATAMAAAATFGSSSCPAYPDSISGGLRLSPLYLTNGSTNTGTRGRLVGGWACVNALPGSNGDTVQGTGSLAGKSFILLDVGQTTTRGRIALEISNTWDT